MPFQPTLPFDAEPPTAAAAPPSDTRVVEELARVCRESPLQEKVLVAPTLSVGHQLVERLARRGTPCVNLRVETVRNLAHGVAGPRLAKEGMRLLSRAQALAFVEQACTGALGPGTYFGALRDRPGLHRALQRTLDELRAAGIRPEDLESSALPNARKRDELRTILRRYEAALRDGRFVDRVGVLRRAVEELRRKRSPRSESLFLVPQSLETSPLERALLDALAGDRAVPLSTDPPESWSDPGRSTEIFRGVGEENELREVFRRVLASGAPWDDVEILFTDAETYAGLVYELASEHEVPCTFSGGIPVAGSHPGQAALGFFDWIGRGFDAEALREMLVAGAIDLAPLPDGSDSGTAAVARALRAAGVGWGRDRHAACLDRLIEELSSDETRGGAERDEEERLERSAARAKGLRAARVARALAERLLGFAPEPDGGELELQALARGTAAFVRELASVSSELDGTARDALLELFEELAELPSVRLPIEDAVERLAGAVTALHVGADRPRPGRVHVAEYRAGGWSGRSRTFVLGLDASRHPGPGLQDPVLLDDERRELNAGTSFALPLRSSRIAENALALQACLARLRGSVTLGYSSWDLERASERFPASFLLDVFRHETADPAADYTSLARALARPSGFVPDPGEALDETEWWLAKLAAGEASRESVEGSAPWLAAGASAQRERESERFTIYDGWLQLEPGELDPRETGAPMSASRIQALARCPFAYYLEHVLRIHPPDRFERDPREWLSALELGTLIHSVFRRFLVSLSAAGEKPADSEAHRRALSSIAADELASWRESVPPRSEAAFRMREDDVSEACRIFVKSEETHCRDRTPRWFEVAFGLPRAESASELASPDPVPIALSRGKRFLLRGRIDRVDECAPGVFEVWDYKSGGTGGVKDGEGIRAGRQVQHALYADATRTLLARKGIAGTVARSGYFFPGRKGRGERIEPGFDEAATRAVLDGLFDVLAGGVFLHAPKKEECGGFCPYQAVCGGSEHAAETACRKLEEVAANPVLEPIRRLRDA